MSNNQSKIVFLIILKDYNFNEYERISIRSQLPVLDFCEICIVSAESNKTNETQNRTYLFEELKESEFKYSLYFQYFDNHYFSSIDGYNALLKEKLFYSSFASYTCMIVSQADVFLINFKKFKDIEQIMSRYDYLGAPWLFDIYALNSISFLDPRRKPVFIISRIKSIINNSRNFIWEQLFRAGLINEPHFINTHSKTGNGGFSIRRIPSFLQYFELVEKGRIENANDLIASADLSLEKHVTQEDVFWSLLVPHVYKKFSVTPASIAVQFSWEEGDAAVFLEYTKGKYPLAIHAWWRFRLKQLVLDLARAGKLYR